MPGKPEFSVTFLVAVLLLGLVTACSRPAGAPGAKPAPSLEMQPGDLVNGLPKRYGDFRSKDLSKFDLANSADLLTTLTFDIATAWPPAAKLPKGFNPDAVLAWGKSPGLGVAQLNAKGITGKGVAVAFVDQPLLLSHQTLKGLDLIYTKVRLTPGQGDKTSMHGPAVTSLLAGLGMGVAPGVKLYFYAHPPWLADQTTHADALREAIKQNRQLPAGQKIRVIGFSDGRDPSEKNLEAFVAAIAEAEAEGIMVVDVEHPFNLMPVIAHPFTDKEKSDNWKVAPWAAHGPDKGALYVPTGGRTAATGYPTQDDAFAYWSEGGLSWAVPYVVGTLALGWQVDPDLTGENAVKYMLESGTPFRGGKLINPQGFVDLVGQRKK